MKLFSNGSDEPKQTQPATSEPAFPFVLMKPGRFAGQVEQVVSPGATLRDYFAAAALSALTERLWVTAEVSAAFSSDTAGFIAREAYAIADAMLAERIKPVKP